MSDDFKRLEGIKIGYALCGSFCTFSKSIEQLQRIISLGADVTPVMSFNAASMDTRFGKAEYFRNTLEDITGRRLICTIEDAEPVGPKKMFDVFVICPCTGNTLAKLAWGIIDTPVTMAAKSHIRNDRPVVIAPSTNDGLAGCAKNIGMLLNYKSYYFVPFGQDDSVKKPRSLVADFNELPETVLAALDGKQYQPIII
ncbi:MAG: dipicolinate synthase subunit B [Oscillospiraceae bacterium]|nr:dipicolinate synthase subunit B [Oscillospiraceae bacterium]